MGNNKEKYQQHLTVTSAEADNSRRLKIFSFLCETQEIANLHATSLDFGYKQLIKDRRAWVLSRIKAEFIRCPLWQEDYTMNTWHKGLYGPFSLRDFELRSADGSTPLVLCTSSWLILDLDTRKMLRTDHVLGEKAEETALHTDAIQEPCGKLIPPAGAKLVSEREVRYSDIDFNGHTNNAKYMEWALDCIDPQLLISGTTDWFQLNINHETHLGDILQFYSCSPAENEFYIEGKIEDTNVFQTLLKLKP